MKLLLSQIRYEISATLARGESFLLTLGIPIVFLLFFSKVKVITFPAGDPVHFVAPGIMALAIMSSAMVSLSISTGFERSYGVLTRLQATPLGRRRLITAKLLALLLVEFIQVVVIALVALSIGWNPEDLIVQAILAVVLATAAFGGIALVLAGRLEGTVNLAVSNGIYILLLLMGGMVIPLAKLGSLAAKIAILLPSGALSQILHHALGGRTIGMLPWVSLSVWAVLAPLMAMKLFRFEANR